MYDDDDEFILDDDIVSEGHSPLHNAANGISLSHLFKSEVRTHSHSNNVLQK